MKQQLSRSIAKNVVIAATMGLAVVTSWAVTVVHSPSIEVGTVNACSVSAAALDHTQRVCRTGAQQG